MSPYLQSVAKDMNLDIETNFIGIHFKDIPVEENNVVLGQKVRSVSTKLTLSI